MTKKLNPLLSPDNRIELIVQGMKKIDILQKQIIDESKKLISNEELRRYQQEFKRSMAQFKEQQKSLELDSATQVMIKECTANAKEVQKEVRKIQDNYQYLPLTQQVRELITQAVKTSQRIEGYTTQSTKHLQEELERIRERYDVKVSIQKK